jgi:hypothetical protein
VTWLPHRSRCELVAVYEQIGLQPSMAPDRAAHAASAAAE